MTIELKVPEIGESINEVTLSQWLVEDGDYVELDQSICEFESDKATLEFPAEKAGKIEILVEEGEDLEIGALIAKIDTSVEAPVKKEEPAKAEVAAEKTETKAPAAAPTTPATTEKPANASPVAANMIAQNGLNAAAISGSGSNGKITKADVLAALKTWATCESSDGTAQNIQPRTATGKSLQTAKDHCQKVGCCQERHGHAHHFQRGGHDQHHGHSKKVQTEICRYP